ncbi:MAG: hypothetical protein NT012_02910 [Candidatus Nealsonbacteria bacterium]|nr:hypothetical protein [Candidatus Nealsonbacteria bacterium]
MAKRTRVIIFLVCSFLFILIAPSIVLYSQGYRIDLENKKFTQTGGLFLKILPRQTDVYIDEKLNKRTDFFFGSVLIENLLPKKYKVEVKKEEYCSWEKTLEIKEKEVIEAKNIILFPQNINFSVLADQVEQFWFFPDQSKIILLEEDKSSSPPSSGKQDSVKEDEESGWVLKLYDLNKNIKSHLIGQEDISPKDTQLINLDFSKDSKKIYLEVSVGEEDKSSSLPFAVAWEFNLNKLLASSFEPFNNSLLIGFPTKINFFEEKHSVFGKEAKISKAKPLKNLLANPGVASDSCKKIGTKRSLPAKTPGIEPKPPLEKIKSGDKKKI